jgi:hypothetical protein
MKYLVFVASLLLIVGWIVAEVVANYDYNRSIGSYWELSDKASTLQQKSTYLDQFVGALEAAKLEGMNNAIFLKTPNNSFDQNMVALKSLQGRMHQIQGMDEQSFAYQTAIQQITGQEQGEAEHLTSVFYGCWYLQNHILLWGWIDLIIWILMFLFALISGMIAFGDFT